MENSSANPTIIGTPIAFIPSAILSLPAILPDVIASHPYLARINPAPTNANVRSNLNTSWNRAIISHNPSLTPGSTAMAGATVAITATTAKPPFVFGKIKETKNAEKQYLYKNKNRQFNRWFIFGIYLCDNYTKFMPINQ